MRHRIIHAIAKTLCECDGKDWLTIFSAERDRYARIAILIDHVVASHRDTEDESELPFTPQGPLEGRDLAVPVHR